MSDLARQDRLDVPQGSDFVVSWPIYDSNGQPQDLAGWTAKAQARPHAAAALLLAEWSSTGLSPALTLTGSTVTLTIPGSQSTAWDWKTGVYDLLLTDPSSRPVRVAEGPIYVSRAVTRGEGGA